MEKLNMHTQDVANANIEKIGQLFPNCLTERLDENGKPEIAIDFDKLKQELSKEIVEGNQERYQFTWPGKREAMRLANTPSNMTLRPDRESSVDFDNTENLYIEGDNLEVLKLLRENYLGKVKMIYIDPPYNTGNDFVYEDDFSQSSSEFKDKSGMFDADGNMVLDRYSVNSESNGRFHTDWLNMIYPRLKVARELLSDDGIIFISIDDVEGSNLRKMCDEVFGATNFIVEMINITGASQNGEGVKIQKNTESCFVYARNYNSCFPNKVDKADESLRNLNDSPSPFITRPDMGYTIYFNPTTKDIIPKVDYDKSLIQTNDEKKVYTDDISLTQKGYIPLRPGYRNGKLNRWRWGLDSFKERKNEIVICKTRNGYNVCFKQSGYNPPKNILNYVVGTSELKELFDGHRYFDFPKNSKMLKYLCSVGADKDSIILDFFSGSATTADAVMQLNSEDQGKRKFILVQLPEPIDTDSEAGEAGYHTICDIAIERIRRAGDKILNNNEQFSETNIFQKEIKLDTGFRVLKLDTSNMQDVYYKPEDSSEATLFEDNVKPDRSSEDLLFQVMPECNLPLSAKIERKTIAGKEVFNVNDGYLLACFDTDVNEAVITEVAKQKPYYFVMRDASLSSDNVADNFEQIFNAYSKDTIRKIL